jgi:hypothetical protein
MIESGQRMKTVRSFFLILAVVGFLISLIVHLLALWGRAPSSESWYLVPILGASVLFVSAGYLSGAKPGRLGMIPGSEIVKGCPTWLKRTEYFFSAYMGLICLWLILKVPGIFHWRKIELPAVAGFVLFSAFAMTFYVSSFSMLFGNLFGQNRQANELSDATHKTT